jgi:hypothetical protein
MTSKPIKDLQKPDETTKNKSKVENEGLNDEDLDKVVGGTANRISHPTNQDA